MSNIPSPSNRDRNSDMKALTKVVLKDLLSFNGERLNSHVAEHPDLLPLYVASALGVECRINWATATEEDCQKAQAWSSYCCSLFDDIQMFVEGKVNS